MSITDNIAQVQQMINGCDTTINDAMDNIKSAKAAVKNLDKIQDILQDNPILKKYVIVDFAMDDLTDNVTTYEETITANKTQKKKLEKALEALQAIQNQ